MSRGSSEGHVKTPSAMGTRATTRTPVGQPRLCRPADYDPKRTSTSFRRTVNSIAMLRGSVGGRRGRSPGEPSDRTVFSLIESVVATDTSRRTPTPVLLQVGGPAREVPGRDRAQQTDERHDRAEVLSHVFLLLAEAALLVLQEPLALLGVQPVTEEAPNLSPYESVGGNGSDPDRAHQIGAELIVGRPALLPTGDVQDLPDRLLTAHSASERRPRVGGMEELEPRVGAELEHDAEILRRRAKRHDRREAQDAPVEPGLPDGLLTRQLLTPVLVRRGDRRVDTERRLAVLDVAEDALGRSEIGRASWR